MRARDPLPGRRNVAVLSWMGLRGGISLAAALAIPFTLPDRTPFPERDLLIFFTYAVILATLVGQGLSLPWVIRRLGVTEDGIAAREEDTARLAAARAASSRLDTLAGQAWVPQTLASFLRSHYAAETARYSARGDAMPNEAQEDNAAAYSRLKRELLDAERDAVIDLRDAGTISDTALVRVQRDLDMEILRLGDGNLSD